MGMQNLRDQLLKAGFITEEQAAKAEQRADRDSRKKPRRDDKPRPQSKTGPDKPAPAKEQAPEEQQPPKPKISKKALMKQPVNRMLDLSDPNMLRIFQAIEQHRVREETKGEVPFHFQLRDGRVRKIFIRPVIAEQLEAGELAIVESGEQDRHVIVRAAAVPLIREVDPEAVRFANEA